VPVGWILPQAAPTPLFFFIMSIWRNEAVDYVMEPHQANGRIRLEVNIAIKGKQVGVLSHHLNSRLCPFLHFNFTSFLSSLMGSSMSL
jgi:hypothetical protein